MQPHDLAKNAEIKKKIIFQTVKEFVYTIPKKQGIKSKIVPV
jgi:hypothetical protein